MNALRSSGATNSFFIASSTSITEYAVSSPASINHVNGCRCPWVNPVCSWIQSTTSHSERKNPNFFVAALSFDVLDDGTVYFINAAEVAAVRFKPVGPEV